DYYCSAWDSSLTTRVF
nr:immunoglobulin light chain junction region [Macaca mulatta]MOV95131.1 immunoglobulin light chain junction region [Macaca mulatta]MOV98148.1 immunoglobulin light chain junction region [Macaca mulatta]MOV98844.1 immunoglobulin light chain junction region [Macaca mulatta]MOV98889.1 immunoglobulin light chain junction region [Macaca mulatta]